MLQSWLSNTRPFPTISEVQRVLCMLNGVSTVLHTHDGDLLDDLARSDDIDTDLWSRICAIAWVRLLTPARLVAGWDMVAKICPWLDVMMAQLDEALSECPFGGEGIYAIIKTVSDHQHAVLGGLAFAIASQCANTSLAEQAQLLTLVDRLEMRSNGRVCAVMATDDDLTGIHATLGAARHWATLGFCIALRRAIRDNDTRRLPTVQAA